MLPLVLALDAVVGFFVLVLKLSVKLAMFPATQTLLMCLGMLFVDLVMDVIVTLIELIMLPVVPTVPIVFMGAGGACQGQRRQYSNRRDYQFTHFTLQLLGSRLIQSQNAMVVASATADRKFAASLS